MAIIFGSARIDEGGTLHGGRAGDQKQTALPDRKGEVSMQDFYMHKKGWVIIRAKDPTHAYKIAKAMEQACNNPNVGYDQNQRLGVISHGTASKVPTECDCSSLVRQCVKEATGKDPGNFTTANEISALLGTRLFDRLPCYNAADVKKGDILVTKTKGHTAVVLSDSSSKAVHQTLRKGCMGPEVKRLQIILNANGAHLEISGVFDSLTEIAVISYQKLNGLVGDGIVGPKTWGALQP